MRPCVPPARVGQDRVGRHDGRRTRNPARIRAVNACPIADSRRQCARPALRSEALALPFACLPAAAADSACMLAAMTSLAAFCMPS
jgi:hypothetical protein